MNYQQHEVNGGVPVKMWTKGVPVEAQALKQLENSARLPIVFKHVAVMPDVHYGLGATIGSVIPTFKAIIPAAVGVDIGCGMMACKTTLRAEDLPDNLGRCARRSKKPCRTVPRPRLTAGTVRCAKSAPGRIRPARPMRPGASWSMSSRRYAWTIRA
jgi:tRNA-splicing ligase RtcB